MKKYKTNIAVGIFFISSIIYIIVFKIMDTEDGLATIYVLALISMLLFYIFPLLFNKLEQIHKDIKEQGVKNG